MNMGEGLEGNKPCSISAATSWCKRQKIQFSSCQTNLISWPFEQFFFFNERTYALVFEKS